MSYINRTVMRCYCCHSLTVVLKIQKEAARLHTCEIETRGMESESESEHGQINHCAGCTMGGALSPAARGGGDQLPNFYHAVLTFERSGLA